MQMLILIKGSISSQKRRMIKKKKKEKKPRFWFCLHNREKQDVFVLGPKYKVLKEVKKFVTQVTLVILDVTHHDFGTYACVAKNPLGESDGTIKLSGMFRCSFQP